MSNWCVVVTVGICKSDLLENVIVTSLLLMGYDFNESDIYEPAFQVEWHNSVEKSDAVTSCHVKMVPLRQAPPSHLNSRSPDKMIDDP